MANSIGRVRNPITGQMAMGVAGERALLAAISHLILIGFTILVAFPVIWMVVASFKSRGEFTTNIWGLPQVFTLDNYSSAWEAAHLGTALLNSLIVAGVTTALVLVLALLAGYALARFKLRFTVAIFLLFILTMQAPVPIIPLYVMIVKIGLSDTLPGLILPTVASGLPLAIFIFRAFFRQIPGELIEAALVDGATRWTTFWRIVIPISTPAIATVTILQFLTTWNDFVNPLILLHSAGNQTLPVALQAFSYTFGRTVWEQVFAALTVGSMPMILIYLLMQRWFIQGLTSGAIKG